MARATTPTTASSAVLLAAALSKKNGSATDRVAEIVADGAGSVVRGLTEVASRSFGGIGDVWDAGVAAGELDGVKYAQNLLERAASRNGWTPDEAAAILNARRAS